MPKIAILLFICAFLPRCWAIGTAKPVLPKVAHYTTRSGLPSNVVNTLMQDAEGYIWIGTSVGLSRFDGYRFVNFHTEVNGRPQLESITGLTEDTVNRRLLMRGNDYRPLCFDLQRLQFAAVDNVDIPSDIDASAERSYLKRARQIGVQNKNMTGRHHDIRSVRLDDGKEIYSTTDNGLFVYDPKREQMVHYTATDEHPLIHSDNVNSILKDCSGSVWIATSYAGVYQLTFDEENLHQHIIDAGVRSFSPWSSHEIVISTMDGSLFCYNQLTGEQTLMKKMPWRIYRTRTDSKGRLWIGTRGGGAWMGNVNLNEHEGLRAKNIYDIVFDRDDQHTVWMATLDNGLVEGHEKKDGHFTFTSHIAEERAHELDFDTKGRLWIATESGVYMKDGQGIHLIYNKGKTVCIAHTSDGAVWAGTSGLGLLKIAEKPNGNGKWVVTSTQVSDGLANNNVKSIVANQSDMIVCGTDEGVSIINHKKGIIRNYYSPMGMMADAYHENAIIAWPNGHVFLGNQKGFVEHTIQDNSTLAGSGLRSAAITEIVINDEPNCQDRFTKLELPHNQNNLTFCFSSFEYGKLSSSIYSYYLEGTDKNWRPPTKEHTAVYNNLSPGHYRFHVRWGLDGCEWAKDTTCDIVITQPLWWTWWARLLYLLIFVLLTWYEWHQYQERINLRRQFDQRLAALYATEAKNKSADKDRKDKEEPSCANIINNQTASPQKDKTEAEGLNKEFLDKLDRIILDNLTMDTLDIPFLSAQMCMSYSTFYRKVKTCTGMTANEYVRKHRLAKAMQLLRDGNSVTETSIRCGFSTPNYFSRCFKAEYGMTPSEI